MAWIISDSISSHTAIQALCGSFIGITTIVVLLRLYARRVQGVRLGTDDWLMLPAYIGFLIMNICALYWVGIHRIGWPTSQTATDHASLVGQDMAVYVNQVFVAVCLGSVKLSALYFYKRIFSIPGRRRRNPFSVAIDVCVVLVVLWTVAFIIFPTLKCGTHPEALYSTKPGERARYCTELHQVLFSGAVTDLALELTIVLLPIPTIVGLRTSLRRRVGVALIFLTAFASVGAAAGRLAIISSLYFGGPITDLSAADAATYFMWIFEAGFAIVAVNIPSLWFLRSKVAPDQVLRSIRSAFSLSSIRSAASGSAGSKNSGRAAAANANARKLSRDDAESSNHGDDHAAVGDTLVPEKYGQVSSEIVSDARRVEDEEMAPRGITVSKQVISVSETQTGVR